MAEGNMQELHQEKQLWLSCDPVTLVTAARDALYAQEDTETPASGPIEEVISRFEQQTRAGIGGSSFVTPPEFQSNRRKGGSY